MKQKSKDKNPMGIKIISILFYTLSIITLISTILDLLISLNLFDISLFILGTNYPISFSGYITSFALGVIESILLLVVAKHLSRKRYWAMVAAIVILVFYLFDSIAAAVAFFGFSAMFVLALIIILDILMIRYLILNRGKFKK